MARVLHVSESGYYKRRSRPHSKRDEEDLVLIEMIAEIFYASHEVFGVRKVTAVLRANGVIVNHKRVARLMSEYCLYSKVRRVRRSFTEQGDENNVCESLLKRDFHVTAPDRKSVV